MWQPQNVPFQAVSAKCYRHRYARKGGGARMCVSVCVSVCCLLSRPQQKYSAYDLICTQRKGSGTKVQPQDQTCPRVEQRPFWVQDNVSSKDPGHANNKEHVVTHARVLSPELQVSSWTSVWDQGCENAVCFRYGEELKKLETVTLGLIEETLDTVRAAAGTPFNPRESIHVLTEQILAILVSTHRADTRHTGEYLQNRYSPSW